MSNEAVSGPMDIVQTEQYVQLRMALLDRLFPGLASESREVVERKFIEEGYQGTLLGLFVEEPSLKKQLLENGAESVIDVVEQSLKQDMRA